MLNIYTYLYIFNFTNNDKCCFYISIYINETVSSIFQSKEGLTYNWGTLQKQTSTWKRATKWNSSIASRTFLLSIYYMLCICIRIPLMRNFTMFIPTHVRHATLKVFISLKRNSSFPVSSKCVIFEEKSAAWHPAHWLNRKKCSLHIN